jgi:hypothetical protein
MFSMAQRLQGALSIGGVQSIISSPLIVLYRRAPFEGAYIKTQNHLHPSKGFLNDYDNDY